MGAELYPPKGMDYNEWLCELMCGKPEEDYEDDRTGEQEKTDTRTDR